MRYGHRLQFEKLLGNPQLSQEKKQKLRTSAIWINDDWWYISEAGDTEADYKKLDQLRHALSRKPGAPKPVEVPITIKNAPVVKTKAPAIPEPPLLLKAVQLMKTVAGPKVKDAVVQARLKKCLQEGGWTFAPKSGVVKAVGPSFVQIENTVVPLPDDEVAAVAVGDTVIHGQTITTSTSSKKCPNLTVKGENLWCGSCGCGERKQAELKNKLQYARVTCPRTPPQFEAEDENGPNIKSGADNT